jgi:redox-sensing transcriptional repressor
VPDVAAQQTFDILEKAGIKGLLNFAPMEIKSNADCIINNVNVAVELENLIYFVNAATKTSKATG